MANNKKSNKSKKKVKNRNLNNETIAALKRLTKAIQDLDHKGTDGNGIHTDATVPDHNNHEHEHDHDSIQIRGFPLNHYQTLPSETTQSYKMLQDGSDAIHALSTKYTLMAKLNLEDASQFTTDLRKGCELIATAVFLIHQPTSGCGRSLRTYTKNKSRAILHSVSCLVEAFASGEALDGNGGAKLTGVLWQACEDVGRLPKGNRACMRRELFGWVRECNETMEEFQELIDLGQSSDGNGDGNGNENENETNDETDNQWDDFCNNVGTGEQYTSQELPIVQASHALIKCSRGILNLSLKACDCAGDAVAFLEQQRDTKNASPGGDDTDASLLNERKLRILQWISNLHELCRKIGEGATDLGCVMYPPLNLSTETEERNEEGDADGNVKQEDMWAQTEIGSQVMEQTKYLLSAAHLIHNPIPPSSNANVEGQGQQEQGVQESIEMSEEVKELCSKLLSAIEKRSNEVKVGIHSLVN